MLSNDNTKEENHHLKRKGNSVFAIYFAKGRLDFSSLGDSYFEMENFSNTSTTIVLNGISSHKDIRASRVNRLVFGHLNINSLSSRFNFLCKLKEIGLFLCYRNQCWRIISAGSIFNRWFPHTFQI